jgi:hypothetical protein
LADIRRGDPGVVPSGSYRAATPWSTRASFQERQIFVAQFQEVSSHIEAVFLAAADIQERMNT